MTELAQEDIELLDQSAVVDAENLLRHYSFELSRDSIERLLDRWLRAYPASWVRLAIIEALYQGRYKAVSADHILALWKRRGQPVYHFNHEFERLICNKIPRSLISQTNHSHETGQLLNPALPYPKISIQLPSRKLNKTLRNPAELLSLKVALTEGPTASVLSSLKSNSHHSGQEQSGNGQDDATETMRSQAPASDPLSPDQPVQTENGNGYPVSSTSLSAVEVSSQKPIHQFVPQLSSSELHHKLQGVVDR
jgi:hypothetical protein